MNGFLAGILNLESSFLMIFIAIIVIIILFKIAKKFLGLIFKVLIIMLIIYLIYNYTSFYDYLKNIFSNLDI